jgi:hypothetical protein
MLEMSILCIPPWFQDFSAKQGCQDGVSNLSDILALHVDYEISNFNNNEELKLNLIIKLLPHDPFSRFFVTEAQFDLREIKFYTQVGRLVFRANPILL